MPQHGQRKHGPIPKPSTSSTIKKDGNWWEKKEAAAAAAAAGQTYFAADRRNLDCLVKSETSRPRKTAPVPKW